MGIAKSFKSLFKSKKKKENDISPSSPKIGKPKNPVSRNKSIRMGIYEPYRNHFPLRQNPIPIDKSTLNQVQKQQTQPHQMAQTSTQLPYGVYNPQNAKLVTANGDYIKNGSTYEYFDPNNRNQDLYASHESLMSNSHVNSLYQQHQLPARNSQLRSSTRSLDHFGESGSVGLIKNAQARLSMRNNMMTGSLTNIHQNATQNGYQYQDWNSKPQGPERSKSVDPFQMMNGSSSSSQSALNQSQLTSSQIGFQSQNLQSLTGLKFDHSGMPLTQNPYEIAMAVRKMEQCLQMLNSLQHQSVSNSNSLRPSGNPIMPAAQQPNQRSFRKSTGLQPQPEFYEREARKKRRLRKKSDLTKFDLSDLRKKLEIIDSTDSGGDSQDSHDKGFCEGQYSSDASCNGKSSPDTNVPNSHSADDSGESSDSGVQTPPPSQEKKEDEFKPILNMTKGILKRRNSQ